MSKCYFLLMLGLLLSHVIGSPSVDNSEQSDEKNERTVSDSIDFIERIGTDKNKLEFCVAVVMPTAFKPQDLAAHIDGDTGELVQDGKSSEATYSGNFLIPDKGSQGALPVSSSYNVELKGRVQQEVTEVWSPYLSDGGKVVLLQDKSTIKGVFTEFPPTVCLYAPFIELLEKPALSHNEKELLDITNKSSLSYDDMWKMLLTVVSEPQAIDESMEIAALKKVSNEGICRSILAGCLYDSRTELSSKDEFMDQAMKISSSDDDLFSLARGMILSSSFKGLNALDERQQISILVKQVAKSPLEFPKTAKLLKEFTQ